MSRIYFTAAVTAALREELARDERVFLMGEDVREAMTGRTAGLVDEFGPERIRNTPISESAFVGAGVGAAGAGMRPIVDVMFSNFLYVAMDQLMNQGNKLRYMMGGSSKFPMTILATTGGAAAAQHSDSMYAQIINGGGIKVVLPSTPEDAKGLVKAAIRDPNPVLVLLHAMLGGVRDEVPDEEYVIPLGQARTLRAGDDVTVVAIGLMARRATEAAAELEADGISVEVIDPRTLHPLDYDTILASVAKTGRLVVVDEARRSCSVGSEIIARVAVEALDSLKAPPRILANPDVHIPYARELLEKVVPQTADIVEAVRSLAPAAVAG
jgi:acetoin:2,6-dichlorophenolindophenol oxidoreductase subunit beta